MSRIPDTHAEAWNLLPWLANGRLSPADREWMEAHVFSCEACRDELAAQKRVSSQMRTDASAPASVPSDEQRSFDKLWSRIEAAEGADVGSTPRVAPVVRPRGSVIRWLAAAVVVQGFGLALLGFHALRTPDAGADFRTVSTVENARSLAPEIRIVFAPEASISSINTLLSHQGLTLVAGPGASGNYTAALSADAVAAGASASSVAAVISRDPNVTFAQPIAR